MRTLATSVAIGAGMAAALSGCEALSMPRAREVGTASPTPSVQDIGRDLNVSMNADGSLFVLQPWPLDDSRAFLCLEDPGEAFTVEHPTPPLDANCAQLSVGDSGDRLAAMFDPRTADAGTIESLKRSSPPWYLAVAGHRGPIAFVKVVPIDLDQIVIDRTP